MKHFVAVERTNFLSGSYLLFLFLFFVSPIGKGSETSLCSKYSQNNCFNEKTFQSVIEWGCENFKALSEIESLKILKGEGIGIKEATWDLVTILADGKTWIAMRESLHGAAVDCFERYEGNIVPWLGCLELKFGKTIVDSFLEESGHCIGATIGEKYQPEEAGKCIGKAISTIVTTGIGMKGAQAMAEATAQSSRAMSRAVGRLGERAALNDPSRMVVGKVNQVTHVYESDDIIYHVGKPRDGSPFQFKGFEGGGLGELRSDVLNRLGITLKDGSLHYPGDAKGMNKKLQEYYQSLPEDMRSNLMYFDAKGVLSSENYLRNWQQGYVPYAIKTSEHFHDIGVHLGGYISLPKNVVAASQKQTKLLLEAFDNPVLKKNPKIYEVLKNRLRSATETLDGEPTFLTNDIIQHPNDLKWIEIRFNRIASPYFNLIDSDFRSLVLTSEEKQILQKFMKDYDRNQKANNFQQEAQRLNDLNPLNRK